MEGRGIGSVRGGRGAISDEVDREGFTEVSSEQRSEKGERVSHGLPPEERFRQRQQPKQRP